MKWYGWYLHETNNFNKKYAVVNLPTTSCITIINLLFNLEHDENDVSSDFDLADLSDSDD